ncbi:TetR/AcrR family transcriptional regulator [Thiospirochaeta perfilievii]|uniref:TetR/AcrR family transcriptional regulator n=1 Tax=Thiospirochaeta perfilievii TaxID=252967 RepID=A0A5C1QDZ5_9SPIO|nr:TetR/AcrR family transcriptional regulator [Thiospirochaeta perfilievii]QEN04944.1 TetR/AcrR family transcriptional regulator [Thiospirochaeta perfilievii]
MPKIVDHEERKRDIMEMALAIFIEEGYSNTKLANIADKCCIARTTLYQYFGNKDDIFKYAIKTFTDSLQVDYKTLGQREDINPDEKLEMIIMDIIDVCFTRRELLFLLLEFLIQVKSEGRRFARSLNRRTIRIRKLFSRIISDGIKMDMFKDLHIPSMTDILVSQIESIVVQLSLTEQSTREENIIRMKCVIDCFRK